MSFQDNTPVPDTFQIKIMSMTGQKFRINVCASDPVIAVLTTLGNYLQIAPQRLQLILKKNTYTSLNNNHSRIVSYGVRHGDTLYLLLSTIQSGPFCFTPPVISHDINKLYSVVCKNVDKSGNTAPIVAWSDVPATTAAPIVSKERQTENEKLRERMNEVRSRIERRKHLRQETIGIN
ncbi:hypothetical protein SARC_02362 [Sphaeroforma arctica JP610]|uniref:Ubiquitin-like domain-containing protein n=1 Tax=Sphaeroforma arctica JP610 TaxID=667725 RepID=A0A0L0G8U8_9EUKA|nr:hypothetical protein SARC_02362 [Sphaeroforma arctica JP610]KNC85457.1 hypothetical protein SARC_02362 [Sphaeroforma arctica JP610]|eukprot:XP_014159359.1 hypothetical protein SARC_02362 [Sphaeroforma arctica JP610]